MTNILFIIELQIERFYFFCEMFYFHNNVS